MQITLKPFLKWAGAKTKLVDIIRGILPIQAKRYIEPFVGSGALFLNTSYTANVLSDSNRDIINLYSVLKAKGQDFIDQCNVLFTAENNSPGRYNQFRDEFNACKDSERRSTLFVYLNRHCFNGLCRYNRSGAFNVPVGRYDRPHFPAAEMLTFAEKLETATLGAMDFRAALAQAEAGDVIYCDPPYVPLTETASFTSYTASGFSAQDQRDLCTLAGNATERGAFVIISNHDTPFTRELYRGATNIVPLMVSRTISCNGQNRGKVKELMAVYGGNGRPENVLCQESLL